MYEWVGGEREVEVDKDRLAVEKHGSIRWLIGKRLTDKTDDLSFIPRTHMIK